MLTNVLGILLAAAAGSGPHAVGPEDVCLLQQRCAREALYCLVDDARCETSPGDGICLVTGCGARGPELLEP